ncbi:MAG: NAD-dependent epimerase/dehydratase family protein [Alphaproteobacteria bacterium]
MTSRALITGGAGFIGAHLAKHLHASGAKVTLVDNFQRGVKDSALDELEAAGVEVLSRDLLGPDWAGGLGQNFASIYHLAAIIGVKHVTSRPYAVLVDNVCMLDSVISLARSQRALERLLFASTSEVYAGSLLHPAMSIPTPETAPIMLPAPDQPRTSYLLSKLYGEAMCAASGVPFTVVRPHNVYGPRMGLSHVIPELMQRALGKRDGEQIDVYSVDHTRTFCYVDDAVAQIQRLADASQAVSRTFNVGASSPEVSIGQLAQRLFVIMGKKLVIHPQPATPGSPARRCPDTSAADAITGLHSRISLDDGLRRTVEWYGQVVFGRNGTSAV